MENTSNQPAEPNPNNLHKTRWLIIVAVIITLCTSGLLLLVWQKYFSQSASKNNIQQQSSLLIKGSDIYRKINQDEEKLFINAKNVTDVRYGPDGKTIHFKVSKGVEEGAYCANPEKIYGPDPASPNDPPQQAPWDYQRIAHAYTITGCGDDGRSGGYLSKSNYFAYVEVQKSGSVTLTIEDLTTHATQQFPIDKKNWNELIANGPDASQENSIHYELTGLQGDNGSTFYYPQEDALLSNGKVVIAIARLLIAIDTKNNTLIGTQGLYNPEYDIIVNSFWFFSNEHSPFMLVASGWEGESGVEALLDVSGSTLEIQRLNTYPQHNIARYKTPFVEWNATSMILHFYKEVDITKEINQKELLLFQNPNTSQEVLQTKNQEIQDRLQTTGKWIEVSCALPSGIGESNCVGLVHGIDYQIDYGAKLHSITNDTALLKTQNNQESADIPSDFTQYANKKLGVSFWYPRAWGKVNVNDSATMITLTFSAKNVGTFQLNKIGALGRGGTPADALIKFAGKAPQQYPATESIDIGNGKRVSLWLNYDPCWEASAQERKSCEEFFITPLPAAASLPFESADYENGLGVYLTDKSSQSVQDFQIMMRSFQLIH